MLLIDKVQVEVILVRTHLVADAAFPRALLSVQRLVQEVHPALLKQNLAVGAAVDLPLGLVVHQDVVQRRDIALDVDHVVLRAGVLPHFRPRDGNVELGDVLRALDQPLQDGEELRQVGGGVCRRPDGGVRWRRQRRGRGSVAVLPGKGLDARDAAHGGCSSAGCQELACRLAGKAGG